MNRSGKQSLVDAIKRVKTHVVLGQESMARGEAVAKLVKQAKKGLKGGKVIVGPGIEGPKGGDSCGTRIGLVKGNATALEAGHAG